jgi:surface antigen
MLGLVLAVGTSAAAADTGGYPYATVPCVYSPYATTGSGYWCSGYNWGTIRNNTGNASELSPYGYDYRNCTDYAAWKLASLGVQPAQYKGLGNANTWGTNATAHGVVSNTTPAVGSVAVSTAGSFGHVAFVTAVGGSQITVSQYNQPQDGTYTTQTGTPASLGFSSFDHFERYETTAGGTSGASSGDRFFLADVNGDGRRDLVIFHPSDGSWWVALSSGTGFWPPTEWAYGHGVGSTNQFVADVNGDGKADEVTYYASTGTWYAGTSSGSGFWPETEWAHGHGVGSTIQLLGDSTGDGKADEIVGWPSTGDWWVGASSGSGFWPEAHWASGSPYG